MSRNVRNWFFIVLLAVSLMACSTTGKKTESGADADFINNWYKILYSEALTVDATMVTLGTMYKSGKFSESDKNKAVAAHVQFKMVFDDAIAKLILYYSSPTDLSKTTANNACVNVQVQVAAITAISILTGK